MEVLEHRTHDIVGVIVIVAKLRRLATHEIADQLILLALKVVVDSLKQLIHGETLLVIDVVLERGESVGDGADAHALKVRGVVAGATGVVILAAGDAVLGQKRHVGHGIVLGGQLGVDVRTVDLNILEVLNLLLVGVEELLEGLEIARVASLDTNHLARTGVNTVVKRNLENLRQVEVTGQRIGLIAPAAGLNTTRRTTMTGIGQALAGIELLVDDLLGVVEGGLAPTGTSDLASALQELARGLAADLHVGVGLDEHHFSHAVENDVGDVVHAILAVRGDTAGIDVGEVGIGAGLLEGHTHLGRCGLAVELGPQALKKLKGVLAVKTASGNVGLIVRVQMLVEAARGVSVPRVRLAGDSEVDKPVALNPLPVGLRALIGHNAAVLRDLAQLLSTLGIALLLSHLGSKVGIAVGKHGGCVNGDKHTAQLVTLLESLIVVQIVNGIESILDLLLDFGKAMGHAALGAQAGMTAGALLIELSEDAGLESEVPLLGLGSHDLLAKSAVLPIRNDDLLLDAQVVLGNLEVDLLAIVHVVHVLERMAAKLRESRGSLGPASLLAHNQLAGLNANGLALKVVMEHLAAKLGDRKRALIALVSLGFDECALHIDVRLRGLALMTEHLDTVVHAAILLPCGMAGLARRGRMRGHCLQGLFNRGELRHFQFLYVFHRYPPI